MMTGCPGVFAGGDMVPAERTVTVGVGHGKKAAKNIDSWLRGTPTPISVKNELATLDMLNLWYFGDVARRRQPELEPDDRVSGFAEVVGGLSEKEAMFESDGACRAGIASSATAASGPARRTPWSNSGSGTVTGSTTTGVQVAERASNSARCTPSRWSLTTDGPRDARRERSGGIRRLQAERGLLHLPHHAGLTDGRTGRRVGRPWAKERVGQRAHGRGDAK